MTDKEERIAIVKSPCYIHNKKTVFKNAMTRSESVERMAKAMCRLDSYFTSCNVCIYSGTKNCKTLYAEAALDALLGGKK